jgi:hypothetical protein
MIKPSDDLQYALILPRSVGSAIPRHRSSSEKGDYTYEQIGDYIGIQVLLQRCEIQMQFRNHLESESNVNTKIEIFEYSGRVVGKKFDVAGHRPRLQ